MKDDILVVGGRLDASPSLSEKAKHPAIIPRGHHVAKLMMREAHLAVGHQGRDHTLWKLRERFWVLGAGADVKKLVKSCVVCRKVNARPQTQMMADLPESRVAAGGHAFEKVGIDEVWTEGGESLRPHVHVHGNSGGARRAARLFADRFTYQCHA